MYWLGEGMKILPNSLQYLDLCLNWNNLGSDFSNMRCLGEGMNQMNNNLKYLILHISFNDLEEDEKYKFKDLCFSMFARLQKLEIF